MVQEEKNALLRVQVTNNQESKTNLQKRNKQGTHRESYLNVDEYYIYTHIYTVGR